MKTWDISIFFLLMCIRSSTLSLDRAIILIRVVVENPLEVEHGLYFLSKALPLQKSSLTRYSTITSILKVCRVSPGSHSQFCDIRRLVPRLSVCTSYVPRTLNPLVSRAPYRPQPALPANIPVFQSWHWCQGALAVPQPRLNHPHISIFNRVNQ